MTLTRQPFGTYTSVEIASANAQTEVIASINSLKALIPDGTITDGAVAGAKVDWDKIPPAIAEQLRAELTFLTVAVEAMPTA